MRLGLHMVDQTQNFLDIVLILKICAMSECLRADSGGGRSCAKAEDQVTMTLMDEWVGHCGVELGGWETSHDVESEEEEGAFNNKGKTIMQLLAKVY